MKQSRKIFDDYNKDICGVIPRDLAATSWCDGGISQIASVINNVNMYNDMHCTANKQNNVHSAVKKPADLSKTFRILKKIQGIYTVSHLPTKSCLLKRIISGKFQELQASRDLQLAHNKKSSD